MTVEQLAREVETMRACQVAYFKTKTGDAPTASKAAERKLDRLVRDILNPPPKPQPSLFDGVDPTDPFAGTKYAGGGS